MTFRSVKDQPFPFFLQQLLESVGRGAGQTFAR